MDKGAVKIWTRIGISLLTVGLMIPIYRLVADYYALPPIGRFVLPGVCLTNEQATYKTVGRAEFYAVDTNCDALAKEEFVEVYAYRNDANSLLPRWLRRRSIVFVYDPGDDQNPLPAIQSGGPNRVKIKVPKVSSVLFKRDIWDGSQIEYEFGKVIYPN